LLQNIARKRTFAHHTKRRDRGRLQSRAGDVLLFLVKIYASGQQ
jgi:hypothetical protein